MKKIVLLLLILIGLNVVITKEKPVITCNRNLNDKFSLLAKLDNVNLNITLRDLENNSVIGNSALIDVVFNSTFGIINATYYWDNKEFFHSYNDGYKGYNIIVAQVSVPFDNGTHTLHTFVEDNQSSVVIENFVFTIDLKLNPSPGKPDPGFEFYLTLLTFTILAFVVVKKKH